MMGPGSLLHRDRDCCQCHRDGLGAISKVGSVYFAYGIFNVFEYYAYDFEIADSQIILHILHMIW